MRPLIVRADLAGGIAHTISWGIALDGLLASVLHRRQLALNPDLPGAREHHEPPDLNLPLARCGVGPDWHWAATCSWPVDVDTCHDAPEVRYWSAAVDHRHLEHTGGSSMPKVLSARQGRYRNWRMPLLVTTCTAVQWYAVGDTAAVTGLLHEIAAIGKKRAAGEGHVLTWTVTEADDQVDEYTAGHLHPDGSLGRPAPSRCVFGRDVPHTGPATAGVRPPYMHPGRQRDDLLLPVSAGR